MEVRASTYEFWDGVGGGGHSVQSITLLEINKIELALKPRDLGRKCMVV